MRLNYNRPPVPQNNAGDTADAGLVKQTGRNWGTKILRTERVENSRDRIGIGALIDGKFDKRWRRSPFPQMCGDDCGELINSAVHGSSSVATESFMWLRGSGTIFAQYQ